MKLLKAVLLVWLMCMVFSTGVMAACEILNPGIGSKARVLQCTTDWTASAGGVATATLFTSTASAKVVKIETIPGALGDLTTSLPTALYDITVTGTYGLDVAAGGLADRSRTISQAIYPSSSIYITGTLTLNVSNAGNAASGRVVITLEE